MQQLQSFYSGKITTYQKQLSRIKEQLFVSSMARLAIFIFAAVGVYLFHDRMNLTIAMIVVALALFLFLVSRHTNLQYKRAKLLALIKINETELNVLKRDFFDLPDGGKFKNSLHYFSQDIDLFGKGSFYQYCNRTVLPQGSETLASLLTENTIANILDKQQAIQELATLPDWRQEFTAIASLVKTETPYEAILSWLSQYQKD